jgi:RNA polymerase sigma-70 factor (ECF subfamily)
MVEAIVGGQPVLKRTQNQTQMRTGKGRPSVARSEASDDSERILVEAAQNDPRRFADLYEENFDRVYAFILKRVGDRDQAQDLTADVFRAALENIRKFEWRGAPFVVWLFRIAANAIIDRGRSAARSEAARLRIRDFDEANCATEVEDANYRARLFKLVDKLPADQCRIITMRFAQEKTIAEIAKKVGRSEGAVKQLQFRGLQALRAMVANL